MGLMGLMGGDGDYVDERLTMLGVRLLGTGKEGDVLIIGSLYLYLYVYLSLYLYLYLCLRHVAGNGERGRWSGRA